MRSICEPNEGPKCSSVFIEQENAEGLEQALTIFAHLLVRSYFKSKESEHEFGCRQH